MYIYTYMYVCTFVYMFINLYVWGLCVFAEGDGLGHAIAADEPHLRVGGCQVEVAMLLTAVLS